MKNLTIKILFRVVLPIILNQSLAHADGGDAFNPMLLDQINGVLPESLDLQAFSKKSHQEPGDYRVHIELNNEEVSSDALINFRTGDDGKLIPCLSSKQLKELGVKIDAFIEKKNVLKDECIDLEKTVSGSIVNFEFDTQQLNLTIPQIALDNKVRGYIPPSRWDDGITAGIINYQFSGSQTESKIGAGETNQQYLNLRSGFNFGSWRVRNYASWNRTDEGKQYWESSSTYLQRTIVPIHSQITLGDAFTPSDVFDSVQIRGVQLNSDENMLPDSMKGFAPLVRGIAKSNATVTIKQNGYVIYQTYVTPGAFELKDLFPTASSGDLYVTVKESDGSEEHFIVPYASVPLLQREGYVKYSIALGKYHSTASGAGDPEIAQFDILWGLPWSTTIYGGAQTSENYISSSLGGGIDLGIIGALSVDCTLSKATLYDSTDVDGKAWRMTYSKSLQTGTSLQMNGYSYSKNGWYSFTDATDLRDDNTANNAYTAGDSKRDRFNISVSQTMSNFGSMYITASQERYWGTSDKQKLLQIGYNNSWDGISYSLAYNYSKSPYEDSQDKQFSLNISVPLDRLLPGTFASYNMVHDNSGRVSQQAGINGTLLDDNSLSYSVMQSHANQGFGDSGNVNLNWDNSYSEMGMGYNYDHHQQQYTYSLSGGAVAHSNGLTFSQSLGDTVVLIKAPGADNTRVQNQVGVKTDWRGYTVLPYATPYRNNVIQLDPKTLPKNEELDTTAFSVVPTEGSITEAKFDVREGYKAIMALTKHGTVVPFGAVVSQGNTKHTYIVGDSGEVYLSGLKREGVLKVQWGKDENEHCEVNYKLNPQIQDVVSGLIDTHQECI